MTSPNRTKTSRCDTTTCAALLLAAAALLVAGCEKKTNAGGAAANTAQTQKSPGASAASGATVSTAGTPAAPPVADPAARRVPKAVPSYWFESDFDSWIGKRWNEIELFQYMVTPPGGMDSGKRYVVFYRRTCEHCEAMFSEDFAPNPAFASMVTAVEVPESEDVLTDPGGWPMPKTECEHRELPLGANWIITTPLSVRVEDGIIQCATEGEHKGCLELE